MKWLKRLIGKSSYPEEKHSPGSVPAVKSVPRRPVTFPSAPKKRGKSPEQYATELAAHRLAMRKHFTAIAAFDRERRIALGITSYKWLSMDVHGTCEVAKKYNGKVLSYDHAPKEGHPWEQKCGSPDWCRCIEIGVIPGLS
jgi:hypothetical protein